MSDAEVADLRAAIAPAFAKMDAQGGEAGAQIIGDYDSFGRGREVDKQTICG